MELKNSYLEQITQIEKTFNNRAKKNNYPKATIRIGLTSGDVIVGNSSDFRNGFFDLYVMGDKVNLAAYLTEKAKEFDPGILIDESTLLKIDGFSTSEEMILKKSYANYRYY